MTESYQVQAKRTQVDSRDVLERFYNLPIPIQCKALTLLHGVIGSLGELGELAGNLERWLWYDQDFDYENFIEELGDDQWYKAELHNAIGISMEEVQAANIRKLRSRYPEKFDQELAKEENRNREEEMKAAIGEIKHGPITSRIVKTASGWEDYFDTKVMDPDGWRNDGDPNWSDLICKEEFAARWYLSTCKQPPKGELKEMVDVLSQRSFKSIGEAISILQASRYEPKPEDYIIPDETIAKIKEDANIRVQQTFSGIREVKEQTGQGFAEPPEEKELPLTEKLFPEGPGVYRNNWGPGGEVVKLTDEELAKIPKAHQMPMPNFDPPYLYGKSRDARTGTNSVGKGFIRQLESVESVEEATIAIGEGFHLAVDPITSLNDLRKALKQDPESPEDGWTVARKIAQTFVDGQNLAYALRAIDSFEEQWNTALKEGKVETEKDRLARTGILALVALRLDLNNTPPIKVEEEIKNLKSLVNR